MQRYIDHVRLPTDRLVVSVPDPLRAHSRVAAFHRDNEVFHRPWDPPRAPDHGEDEAWKIRLQSAVSALRGGAGARFYLFLGDEAGPVVGFANLSSILRGPFQCCNLGYALDQGHTGRGYMTEALRAILPWAFEELGLHRIQANHLPENTASATLLRRLGFVVEGYARDYLFIDGKWRDHVLNSLTSPRPRPAPAPPRAVRLL